MRMRELIDTIDLMETELNNPFPYQQTNENEFTFSFDLHGAAQAGVIRIEKATVSGQGVSGKETDDPAALLASMFLDDDEQVSYGYLHYKINDKYTGFNTGGNGRRILSTVIMCTKQWLEQNPDAKYIMFSGESDSGANNRPQVYQALTAMFAKKLGFKVVINGGDEGGLKGTYLLQVRK